MARRDGGRGGRTVPGVCAALADRSRAFGRHWGSRPALDFATALERGEPVTVDGQSIWRALFERRYPDRWDEFMNDESLYTVVADRLAPVENGQSGTKNEKGARRWL